MPLDRAFTVFLTCSTLKHNGQYMGLRDFTTFCARTSPNELSGCPQHLSMMAALADVF